MKLVRLSALLLACVLLAAAVAAGADEKKDESKVVLSWDQFRAITGWDGKVAPGEILIPWPEVEKLLGVDLKVKDVGDKATLKLPWNEFRALVEWSVAKKGADLIPPPADYVITKATYTGTLAKDVATFELNMTVSILKKRDWKRIRILPATVGVDKVELPGTAFLNVAGSMYEVLTQDDKDLPVKLTFAAPVSEEGGLNNVSFDRVPSGTCIVDLGFAAEQKDVKLTVAGAQDVGPKDAKRRLFAVPAGNRVAISWERELKEAVKAAPKLYAQTETLVAVGDGLLTCREKVTYSVVLAGVRDLSLNVPDGVNVLDVRCPFLHDWRVDNRKLALQLEREVKGVHEVSVTYEKGSPEKGGSIDTPVLTTADTERERGSIAVVALTNVEIAGTPKDGASSVDVGSLPAELVGLTGQPVLLAYRYVGRTFSVPLEIKKHEDVRVLLTIVDAATFTVMQTPEGRRIVSVVYDVRNNRNQFLRVKLPDPAKMEIWTVAVAGKAVRPAEDKDKIVLIPLVRSTGQQLTAFPVEIVYVDKTMEAPKEGCGTLNLQLPQCNQPIMNVMCALYLPKEGRYTVSGGTLKEVADFRELQAQVTEEEGRTRTVQVEQQAGNIQKAVDEQLQRAAPTGVTPIKVTLPLTGTTLKFQKILVLEEEQLGVEIKFTRWSGYRSGWLW